MEDYILGLYISMNYPIRVKFIDSLAYLPHDYGDFMLRHALMLFQLFEQLPSCSDFQNYVDIEQIIKKAIHLDYVRVVKECLNF